MGSKPLDAGASLRPISLAVAGIRRARPRDSRRALEIWRAAVDATHHFLRPEDRRAIDAEVAGFLPRAALWLAVDADDRPLGFLILGKGHMDALFVDPAFHGRGVGRSLVEHALSLHPALTTEVNAQNLPACAFYRRLGFVETGRSECDSQGRPYPLIFLRKG